MDIHRLIVFCKVIELQSFTRAAEAVSLTQPTVSEHIRALEDSVGEKLIDRLGREILPTPAGKILYQYAREIILLREKAMQALQKFKGNLSGSLCIGASTIPGTYILPSLIGSFKASYPSTHITLRIGSSGEVVQKVLDGTVEFGMIGAKWEEKRVALEEVYSDELPLVVYPGHPWDGRQRVRLEELGSVPFVSRERGSGTRAVMQQALESAGFSPSHLNIVSEMGSTEAVRQAVKAKVGVAILSLYAVIEEIERKTLIPLALDRLRITRPFYLAQRKNREASPLCTAFLEHLRADASARQGLPCSAQK